MFSGALDNYDNNIS